VGAKSFIFTVVFLIVGTFIHGAWIIETVDGDNPGGATHVLLTSDGEPIIVYNAYWNSYIRVATWTGVEWVIEEVANDCETQNLSATIDSQDRIHIAYGSVEPDHGLKYIFWDGLEWQTEIIDDESYLNGRDPCIAVDSNDWPRISYQEREYNDLRYAYYDGIEWHKENVTYNPLGIDGYRSCIVLDDQDTGHISFFKWHQPGGDLKYAYQSGDEWVIELVDCEHEPFYTCIALDGEGNPWICYSSWYNYEDEELCIAKKIGAEWEVETVYETTGVSNNSYFKFDSDGIPHFVYYDGYVTWNGAEWITEPVDPDYGLGYASLFFDVENRPHVSYVASTDYSYELRYAYFENYPPSSFDLLQPLDGDTVSETPTLDWEDSTDDDGDTITYNLWYATDASFDPHDEITELTDSTYTFSEGVLTDDTTYYWKVRAWDGYDETWSGPGDYWSFTVDNEVDIPVTLFSAESARDGIALKWEYVKSAVGFNLYRLVCSGAAAASRELINDGLITGASPYSYVDANVSEGVTYSYWLEVLDVGGSSEMHGPVECTWNGNLPVAYALYQSRPNPARGEAAIAFDLPETGHAKLTVYDIAGREVAAPVDRVLPAGTYETGVSGLAPGVYIYRLAAGDFRAVKKMVVVE
jgi:hypothetical protein